MSTVAPAQDLRYPVGKFVYSTELTSSQRREAIDRIQSTPAKLRAAVRGLSTQQLDTPYRPGGWTVRQVVHHLPDSHGNAFFRTKHALTEDEPTIKAYDEQRWAELADARVTPVETSLSLLDAIHERWNYILREIKEEEFSRTLRHPEHGLKTIDWLIALYAWHGEHHVAHITSLRSREGW
ncbi:MAG: putative metal-dependent hydrolase [Acidobacteria bacterium]|nr:putative metal-dependent hydrolase [Acidobacteriota bacterium]MBV9146718.1 putative metal-dependent hydrolase [Acidobacteriota bacterium]MBV9434723.1 putative metal-dependent hydrolase [Acidobacteriota bacterium]